MPTPNLRIRYVPSFVRGTELRVNPALEDLDGKITEELSKSVASADILLSHEESLRNMGLTFTGSPGAAREVTVLLMKKFELPRPNLWFVRNVAAIADEVTLAAELTTASSSDVVIPPGLGKWLCYFDNTELFVLGMMTGKNRQASKDLSWTSNSLDLAVDEFRARTLTGNTSIDFNDAAKGSYYFQVDSAAGAYTFTLNDATIVRGAYVTDGTVNHIKATSIQGPGDGSKKWIAEIFQE